MTSGTSKYLRKWMKRVQQMVRMEEQEVQMEKELMERVEEEKNPRDQK